VLVNRERLRYAHGIFGDTAEGYQLRDNETAGAGVRRWWRYRRPP
jgi:hypothetical protein